MSFFDKLEDWYCDNIGDFTKVVTFGPCGGQLTTKTGFAKGISDSLVLEGFLKSTGVFAQRKVKEISSNYTITKDDNILLVDANLGNIVLTLPSRIIFWDDVLTLSTILTVKRKDTNALNTVTIILQEPGETIDGDPDVVLDTATTPSVNIFTNGLNFFTYGT